MEVIGGYIATALDSRQIVRFEELIVPQVIQQEALTRLLVEKGIITEEEFLEMVKAVNQKMKSKKKVAV